MAVRWKICALAATWWATSQRMNVAAECVWAERRNKNGQKGRADRIQFRVDYLL